MRWRPGPGGEVGAARSPAASPPPPKRCVPALREPRAPQAEGWGLRRGGVSASRPLSRGDAAFTGRQSHLNARFGSKSYVSLLNQRRGRGKDPCPAARSLPTLLRRKASQKYKTTKPTPARLAREHRVRAGQGRSPPLYLPRAPRCSNIPESR